MMQHLTIFRSFRSLSSLLSLTLCWAWTLCFDPSLDALTPSEMQEYRALCKKATQNESTYKKLRKSSIHRKIIEPFAKSNQKGYCLQIERETFLPNVLYTQLAKWDHKIKGPKCQQHFALSPLALRHGQIAIELEREFGPLKSLRILQIGGGFGHLAAYLSTTTGYGSYTLLDLPECLDLQKKFLSSCGVSNVHTILLEQSIKQNQHYDLVLCVFPFTEWSDATQRAALLQHIAHIPKGYITCHAPWHPSRSDNAIEDTLLLTLARAGHSIHCAPERGAPLPLHSVIRWGTQETQEENLPSPTPSRALQKGSAVVAEGGGGRLGDKLLLFAHAKWVARRYHLPLLVRTFPYSESFALSKLYPLLDSNFHFARERHPKNHREISQFLSQPSTLFVIDFFAETDFESGHYPYTGAYFYTNWRDRGFLHSLRKDLAPQPQVLLEEPLLDHSDVHLAVHLRLGGGFDNAQDLQSNPVCALKSPQHAFYLEQIERVAGFFPQKSIQVHLFTDDPDPQALADMYADALNNPRLHFTYRTAKNRHDLNVLDDFFAMSAYDCLIHPQSYFSCMASLLGDFAVRITPAHATWKTTYWVIDQVECALDGSHRLFQHTP